MTGGKGRTMAKERTARATPATPVETRDAEIADLTSRLTELGAAYRAAKEVEEAADRQYGRLTMQVNGGGDEQLRPELERAAAEHDRKQRAVRDLERAMQELAAKRQELEAGRAEAQRRDYEAELRTISTELEPLGAELDAYLAAVATKLEVYIDRANRAANLRKWSGYGTIRTAKSLAVDVVRTYLWRALTPAFSPPDMAHAELLGFESIAHTLGRIPARDNKDTAA